MSGTINIDSPFPLVISTVDMVILDKIHNPRQILLGQKKHDPNGIWRFAGGFTDKGSFDDESDAIREIKEETGLDVKVITYIGGCPIDDKRYRDTPHQVRTRVHITEADPFSPDLKAGDDLETVRWFDLEVFNIYDILIPEHKIVFDMLVVKCFNLMPRLCKDAASSIEANKRFYDAKDNWKG